MEQRRFFLFVVLSMTVFMLWMNVVVPRLHPELFQKPKEEANKEAGEPKDDAEKADQAAEDQVANKENGDDPPNDDEPEQVDDADNPQVAAQAGDQPELKQYPAETVTLGSLDPASGYYLEAKLSSKGASIESVALNDPRYKNLEDKNQALRVIGDREFKNHGSLTVDVPAIDAMLIPLGTSLADAHWGIRKPEEKQDDSVTFFYELPDESMVVTKTFKLNKATSNSPDTDFAAYTIDVTLEIENRTQSVQAISYAMQGPVGLPVENIENARRFMELQFGFKNGDSIKHVHPNAKEIAKQFDKAERYNDPDEIETYQGKIQYMGVDVQYFAALLQPNDDESERPYVDEVAPVLLEPGKQKLDHSEISLKVRSQTFDINAGETLKHDYTLYAGPKRNELLAGMRAGEIIDYGWFGMISKLMLTVMNFFHDAIKMPYGIAIIMLTVIVRGVMYPISRRQALMAKRMKVLQPEFEAIRKKYADDKEKLALANLELMKKHNIIGMQVSGCLPMLLQLPIFIGLYQALNNSVDLRLASFLWVDNLAAPDALFDLPFRVPLMGWTEFNLLPIITIGLFIVQQKLFTPPPTSEEQEQMQKTMQIVPIIFGVFFYQVPAGLCVYFIASTFWGITERKILDWQDKGGKEPVKDAAPTSGDNVIDATFTDKKKADAKKADTNREQPQGLIGRLMSAVDSAANPDANKYSKRNPPGFRPPKSKGKSKKK